MAAEAIAAAADRLSKVNPQDLFQGGGFVLSKLYSAIDGGTRPDLALGNARRANGRKCEEDGDGGVSDLAQRLHRAADNSCDIRWNRFTLSRLQFFVDHVLLALSKTIRRKALATPEFTGALKTLLQEVQAVEQRDVALAELVLVETQCTALVRRAERAQRLFSLFFSRALEREVKIRTALINDGRDPVVSLIDLVGKAWRPDLNHPDDFIRKILFPQLQSDILEGACSSRDPQGYLVIMIQDDGGNLSPYVNGATARRARDLVLSQHVPAGLTQLVTKSVTLFEFFKAGDQRLHALLDSQRDDTDALIREFLLGSEGAAQERQVAAEHGHIDIEMTTQAIQESRAASTPQAERPAHSVTRPRRSIQKQRHIELMRKEMLRKCTLQNDILEEERRKIAIHNEHQDKLNRIERMRAGFLAAHGCDELQLEASSRLQAQGELRAIMFSNAQGSSSAEGCQVRLSDELRKVGLPASHAQELGRLVKKYFTMMYPGQSIPRSRSYFNGEYRESNCYFECHRPAIEAAIRELQMKHASSSQVVTN